MSFLDKIAASLMPPERAEDRANVRKAARSLAGDGDWLALVIHHHYQIESLLDRALNAGEEQARINALHDLSITFTGHANAEESVLYPALAAIGEKGHAAMAYQEQAMARIELALLEKLDPKGGDWREKLEHVQRMVLHHVYEEEGTWFAELQQKLSPAERLRLSRRFLEEFDRYARGAAGCVAPLQMTARQTGQDSVPTGM